MPEEEKKDEDKIILQVDMHCEGCKAKVRKALKEFKGVEGLDVNMQDQRVTIKGKLDAKKVYETVKKKSGKRTILVYPDLSKVAEDENKAKEEPKKEEPPPPAEPEVVVVLKVNMHCAACAKQIRRSLLKMEGVTDAKEDFAKCTVTVKGKNIDPNKLCARVKKRSRKHCEIVLPPPPPPAPSKEEEKKEEAKPAEEKKEEEKKEEAKPAEEAKKEEEKPAEAAPPAEEGEKKAEEKKEDEKKEAAPDEKKEEKPEEKKEEEKKEEASEETKTDIKKYEYMPYRSVPEYYVYPPQLFSDENPNACSVM